VTPIVVLRPEAVADVIAATQWYDGQRQGLGVEFTDEVDKLINQISTEPELYAPAIKEVRRAKVRRFPYIVYYRILTNRIEVLGVMHGNRDPRKWQNRT